VAVHNRWVEGRRDHQGLEHRAVFVTIRNSDDGCVATVRVVRREIKTATKNFVIWPDVAEHGDVAMATSRRHRKTRSRKSTSDK